MTRREGRGCLFRDRWQETQRQLDNLPSTPILRYPSASADKKNYVTWYVERMRMYIYMPNHDHLLLRRKHHDHLCRQRLSLLSIRRLFLRCSLSLRSGEADARHELKVQATNTRYTRCLHKVQAAITCTSGAERDARYIDWGQPGKSQPFSVLRYWPDAPSDCKKPAAGG